MSGRWANHEEVGYGGAFEALHTGLAVRLIATSRASLMTCKSAEAVSAVVGRNTEQYDFIPVTSDEAASNDGFIGLFHAEHFRGRPGSDDPVAAHLLPLSENFLIGADASILDFLVDADLRPCRLVVSGTKIAGLVSISDLQRLPVRAALFALVTGFEITMSEAIRRRFKEHGDWMGCLTDGRREKIQNEIAKSLRDDGFVDTLLFTQFSDKADIIARSFQLPQSKTKLCEQLREIQKLRDNLAHANEYAASPLEAKHVCYVVRSLLALKDEIANAERASGIGNAKPAQQCEGAV